MSDENDDAYKVDHSPTTMTKNTRRIGRVANNLPYKGAFLAAVIMVGLIIWAVYKESQAKSRQPVEQTSKSGSAFGMANDFLVENQGVIPRKPEPVVEQPKPEPKPEVIIKPVLPKPEPKEEKPLPPPVEKPAPAPSAPPPPIEDPNIARFREMRLQMAENAIKSQVGIKATGAMSAIRQNTAPAAGFVQDSGAAGTARSAASGDSDGADPDYSARSDLSATGQFSGNSNRWKLGEAVEAPTSRFLLRTGSVIPATLITGLNSDLPGQIIAQVSQNVFDSASGHHLLIPQGARLIGEYSSKVQYGQSRVFAVWQRIIFPDGKTLDIGAMPASTGAGYSGLKDRVNNHYARIFGSALMMSAVIAGIDQAVDNSNSSDDKKSMSDSMSEALGNTFGNLVAEMMRKNMSIAPTIEIRPGFRLNVMLVKDLQFKTPYRSFDYMPSSQARASRNHNRIRINSR